jgi:hypothetical protein
MSNVALLSSLQTFFNQRSVAVEGLSADSMVKLIVDWFRLIPIDGVVHASPADALVFRYGGWSEGCVTGFKFGLLRRITAADESKTEWLVGISMLFEPSRYSGVEPVTTISTDWPSLEAFVTAIESSVGFKLSNTLTPMAISVDSLTVL